MPDITVGYGRLSDLNESVWEFFIYYYMFETLYLSQTFTNFVLRQKFRDEK